MTIRGVQAEKRGHWSPRPFLIPGSALLLQLDETEAKIRLLPLPQVRMLAIPCARFQVFMQRGQSRCDVVV
jgi:hypothetical protein